MIVCGEEGLEGDTEGQKAFPSHSILPRPILNYIFLTFK